MAATRKAPWTICAMVLLAEAATAMTVQVRENIHHGIHRHNASRTQVALDSFDYSHQGYWANHDSGTSVASPGCENCAQRCLDLGDTCVGFNTNGGDCANAATCFTYTDPKGDELFAGHTRAYTRRQAASAIGDPHLQNIHGERFDLMKPGKHVLINIPREARAESAMLRVEADARRLGRSCADLYFEELNITGLWAEAKQAGGYHYGSSSGVKESPEWLTFGQVAAKVVHGRTQDGVQYLNLYVKHLGRAGFVVGGLLGEDDYHDVAAPDASCVKKIALDLGIRTNSPDARSFAIASAS